jgi:Prealbumin-like fold domain
MRFILVRLTAGRSRLRQSLAGRRRRAVLTAASCITAAGLTCAAVSSADLPGGCDFSPANNGTPSCSAPLSGSTFAGGDGNLLASPTTFGTTDWQNVAGLNPGFDLTSGKGDNSFGQGTKEDDPNVSVVTGSIPPNKSDLTRFYEASSTGGNGHNFVYLAWERSNVLGTANFDFEINQKTQPDLTTTGAKTLKRTAGDLLVTFDFNNGGGKPVIGLLRWLTGATTPAVPGFGMNVCLAANTFPCWGDQLTLDGTDSIGAVNNLDPVADPLFPNQPNATNPLPALQFGETAIDLSAAGVFAPGTCTAFGSAFVRSRSSSAFTAEIKDFIAPIPVNISNCGEIKIIKHTDPRGINQNFGYTSSIAGTQLSCTADTTPASFTLNDSAGVDGTANVEDCKNVPLGSYTVVEGAEPTGFALESLTCQAGGSSSGSQDAGNPAQANITLAAGNDVVTCTYVNQQQLGAIKISKTSSKTGHSLAGAVFSITGPNSYSNSVTTGADGTACVDNLPFGSYTVTETAAPAGFIIDDATGHSVTVDNNAKCSDSPYAGETTSFADTPTADIQVRFRDGGSGETSGTISCDNATGLSSTAGTTGWDATTTVTGIHAPTTVTCTIEIDP